MLYIAIGIWLNTFLIVALLFLARKTGATRIEVALSQPPPPTQPPLTPEATAALEEQAKQQAEMHSMFQELNTFMTGSQDNE